MFSPVEEEEDTKNIRAAKDVEVEGVKAAENGNLSLAVDLFSRAISLLPDRPSGYNNRAQALRLMGKNSEALCDLDKAISLDSKNTAGRVNALCQRSLLRRLAGDEEGMMSDLRQAAAAGHDFARQMLVQLNPYSALCNQMLKQMMQELSNL